MKQFLYGVAASLVSGLVLLWAGFYYSDWATQGQRSITYEIDSAATFFAKEELDAVLAMANAKQATAKVALINIANSGSKTLKNVQFTIRPTVNDDPKVVYGFGLATTNGGEILSPSMERTLSDIEVEFPILRPEQGAVLWIAHIPPQGFEIINKNDDVEFSETSSIMREFEQEEGPLMFAIGAFVIFGVGAMVGLFAADRLSKQMIKKAGYDPAEIEAAYLHAIANEKLKKDSVK